MSIIADYASLQTTIAEYAHRSDLTAEIPGFIQMAEQRLATDLRVPEMQATESRLFVTDTEALPVRFEGMRAVTGTLGNRSYSLSSVGPNGTQRYAGLPAVAPYVYRLDGSTITIPGGTDSTFVLDFWQFPAPLVSVSTNPVLTNYPICYLYASLIEVASFTMDLEAAQAYSAAYQAAMQTANRNADDIRFGSSPTMSAA
jgi:hypothetical protein